MARPWYREQPKEYEAVRLEVESAYPELWFVDEDARRVVLRGWYPLYEGSKVWDRYQVEIILPTESAKGFPIVREVGRRIPAIADRHVFANGTACIALEDAYWFEFPEGLTLLEFLNGPMRSYFASQSLIEEGQPAVWADGEWAHGAEGIFEFYAGVVATREPLIILEYLKLLERDVVKGHWPCPCRSGEKLRKCHGSLVYNLRSRVPLRVARKSRILLEETIARALSRNNKKV